MRGVAEAAVAGFTLCITASTASDEHFEAANRRGTYVSL